MHTILGSSGAIGIETARSLAEKGLSVRLVSRNPKPVTGNEELVRADLSDPATVEALVTQAIAGSEVVYVTIGFPYRAEVWERSWPPLMEATIQACRSEGVRLVFFDNVYLDRPEAVGNLTEESPIGPHSRKGRVRERLWRLIEAELSRDGGVPTAVARAPDFANGANSVLRILVVERLVAGKRPQWLGRTDVEHSFIDVVDAGRATAQIGTTLDAFGAVWHLPTDAAPRSLNDWIDLVARELEAQGARVARNRKAAALSHGALRLLGLFSGDLRELSEMFYQYDRPYHFNSSRFETRFGVRPTSGEEIVRRLVAYAVQARARS
ncbi:MAG: NAD(P)H-binding protein [Spirochaetales bacterium]|nr:NAD(P)H-binding protein [Spirochaetales bacterium]